MSEPADDSTRVLGGWPQDGRRGRWKKLRQIWRIDSGGLLVNAKEPWVHFKACLYTKAEQSIRDSQTVSKTTRPFLFLSKQDPIYHVSDAGKEFEFLFRCVLGLESAVCMNSNRQCALSIEQRTCSHWLNQNILTTFKDTEASKLEFKWCMSQNRLQMETESPVGSILQKLHKTNFWKLNDTLPNDN